MLSLHFRIKRVLLSIALGFFQYVFVEICIFFSATLRWKYPIKSDENIQRSALNTSLSENFGDENSHHPAHAKEERLSNDDDGKSQSGEQMAMHTYFDI